MMTMILRDLVKGAIAGAVATATMDRVTSYLFARESRAAIKREHRARGGWTSTETAAERLAASAGVRLSTAGRKRGAAAIHWTTGVAAGALYGALRPRVDGIARGRGLLYGFGIFLILDELMNPSLGLTPGPLAFPWQAHARGLGGHLAYGLAGDLTLSALQRGT